MTKESEGPKTISPKFPFPRYKINMYKSYQMQGANYFLKRNTLRKKKYSWTVKNVDRKLTFLWCCNSIMFVINSNEMGTSYILCGTWELVLWMRHYKPKPLVAAGV
jgi:hypothetical protein